MTDDTRLDLSTTDSAEDAARKLAEYLCEYERDTNGNPSEVLLMDPEMTKDKGFTEQDGVWMVMWEAGPSEWALALTGGNSLAYREFMGDELVANQLRGSPEVVGFQDAEAWSYEHYYSFDIMFYPEGR